MTKEPPSPAVPAALPADSLYRRCDPESFAFRTTADLPPFAGMLGQDRAIEAVRFGIGIRHDGYNLFAIGPSGSGKHTLVHRFVAERAATAPAPPDLCYVHNFKEPHRPKALVLPSGRGAPLRRDMENLLGLLKTAIPATFESEDYRARRRAIEEQFKNRQGQAFAALQEEAQAKGIALIRTPMGLALAPTRGSEVVSPEEFEKLPEAERERLQTEIKGLQEKLEAILREIPNWERAARDKVKELNRDVTNFSIGHMIAEMHACYDGLPQVQAWLDEVRQDLIDNVEEFLAAEKSDGEEAGPMGRLLRRAQAPRDGFEGFKRYRVNLMVDNGGSEGAPVIYEDNPNLQSLFGRIEHIAQFGAMTTDFTLIQPGALHRANGGYLILDARKVLLAPFAWEELKRALKSRMLRIDTTNQVYSVAAMVSLEPQPVPLDVKVALLGEHMLYYLLSSQDPDFGDLFKVAVEFATMMDRDAETLDVYARLIGELARSKALRPLDRTAVARVVEHASREAGDAGKVTIHMRSLVDMLVESDYWAGVRNAAAIAAEDVQKAIDARIRRADLVRERSHERIIRDTVLIDTQGAVVGQINGLTVMQLGDFSFGQPSRITARVRMGRGDVVDIEREVALGGPIHSKGVLILSSFLAARFLPEEPLSLRASLVFEQSYGGVEGDSASSAELYALLSALSDVPIRQSFAVTGSVNQMGQVQAIGGVNEKIEGFFDICRADGLTGEQGVLIPASNVKHLMLRRDVRDAVVAGRFRVHAVTHIDQGIELLTGVAAGARQADGRFPAGTINALVEARLARFAKQARRAAGEATRASLRVRPARRERS